MNILKYTHSDPLPMGGHKNLIQEQFRSFEEPGPQDSCDGFFVSSQALRNLLKRLHSWTVSGQCRVPVIPALSRLRQEDDQAWGQFGLPNEVPPPLPPKKWGREESSCVTYSSLDSVSPWPLSTCLFAKEHCVFLPKSCALQHPGCRFYCVCFWSHTQFAIRYSIPRIRQLCILLLCLEWYGELNSEPMLGRHPLPELYSQPLVLSF